MNHLTVIKRDGSVEPFNESKITAVIDWAMKDLVGVARQELLDAANLMFFNNIKTSDIHDGLIRAAGTLISHEKPNYSYVASRLLLQKLYKQIVGGIGYPHLHDYLERGVFESTLDSVLLDPRFDHEALDAAIVPERDLLFKYLGLQTLADRYFIRAEQRIGEDADILEMPQHFWMRVAMGLSINESDPTAAAIETYNALSTMQYVNSTPTLFNSGTKHSQMSSCYLNMVADTITAEPGNHQHASIFGTIEECANLSKYAGGIGTDWTPIRGANEPIKGTNGKSSGVIPYLKIYNDTAIAVNQGGKRNGAFAPYLEIWHPDVLDFMELKKNTGDERRRCHDIYPAIWAADLFFQRVEQGGVWSFFSPNQYPELHELYGPAFESHYIKLEAEGKFLNQMPAIEIWRKWLTMLHDTGHPWVTFKDEANRRNPQDHVGRIHNSNLCTEITLNTSDDETAVCNLGSIVLRNITSDEQLRRNVHTLVRNLDNVIDINFYPSERARISNMRHRPIGTGVMGETEWLVMQNLTMDSPEGLEAIDRLYEKISFYAIEASMLLAKERGPYSTFVGSKWSRGILPIDTARDKVTYLGAEKWQWLREQVMIHGMRNSNVMAIAPTATISNIVGTEPSIEPPFRMEYTKSNLSGPFIVIAPSLEHGKPHLVKAAHDYDQTWLIRAAAKRQKWIDQAQSLNLYVKNGVRGRDLSEMYMLAWRLGLKTTYYLRSESNEVEIKEPRKVGAAIPQSLETAVIDTPALKPYNREEFDTAGTVTKLPEPEIEGKVCAFGAGGPDCTSCQ